MTTKKELNDLLSAYESYIGGGNMKQAGRTLPKIIHALVQFVEERTPDIVTEYDNKSTLGNMQPEKAKAFFDAYRNPEPCTPCDVSIPDNKDLISDFKMIPPSTKSAISKTKKDRNSLTIAFGHASKAIAENPELYNRISNNLSESKTAKPKKEDKPKTTKTAKVPTVKKPKK